MREVVRRSEPSDQLAIRNEKGSSQAVPGGALGSSHVCHLTKVFAVPRDNGRIRLAIFSLTAALRRVTLWKGFVVVVCVSVEELSADR
jgi:hypothetical protein